MGVFYFILLCLAVGLVVGLIWKYAPIPQPFKTFILWAAIAILVLLLCNEMGLFGKDITIPKLR